MNGRAMNGRQIGNRTNRRALVLGVALSAGLHAWVLAGLTLDPVDTSRPAGEPEIAPPQEPFEVPELVLLSVVEEEEADPLPLPAESHPIVAEAAPAPNPEPAAQNAEPGSQASAAAVATFASATIESAPQPTLTEILEAGLQVRAEIAVTPHLVVQRSIDEWDPVEAIDPHAGHDHDEDELSRGSSIWRRIGRTFGIGGDLVCRPVPKVVKETG